MLCSTALAHWWKMNTYTNVRVHVRSLQGSKRITKVRSLPYVSLLWRASRWIESLWHKTFFSSHLQTSSPIPRARVVGGVTTWIVRMGAAVIMKKCSNHEIFTTKIYIHVISWKFWITKIWSYLVLCVIPTLSGAQLLQISCEYSGAVLETCKPFPLGQ